MLIAQWCTYIVWIVSIVGNNIVVGYMENIKKIRKIESTTASKLRYTTVFKLSEQSAFDFFKQGWVYFNANENVYENLRLVWKMKK